MTTHEAVLARLQAKPHPWAHVRRAIGGWLADRRDRKLRRTALLSLAEMETWQLRDIGIDRTEVERLIAASRAGLEQ